MVFLLKLVYCYDLSLARGDAVEYEPYVQLIRPTNMYARAQRRVEWPAGGR